jgi:hypothetical protein
MGCGEYGESIFLQVLQAHSYTHLADFFFAPNPESSKETTSWMDPSTLEIIHVDIIVMVASVVMQTT